MIPYETDTYTDDQIYRPDGGSSGGDTSTATITQPSATGITSAPSGPATTDPVGSNFFISAVTGTETPSTATETPTAPVQSGPIPSVPGASNMHLPGEVWQMGAGQGCAPGYAEQMRADGSWTCIPMSDFQKIFSGDFSPLSPGRAPEGVAPVSGDSSVYVGGVLQGTAQQVAEAAGSTWGAITTAITGSTTQGPSGGGSTAVSNGGTSVDRLIDLASMMFAGAGVKGGGTGFGGFVSGPVAGSDTGGGTTAAAPTSHTGLIIVVLIAAGLGFWYYKKHHKKGAT